ncbi:hypothetical protein NM22_02505 [Vibrio tubiashii]|uniref:STAS/SEC14 domain-containing protein n=1 Tax=Vibrio sp. M260118 TaxID=3020896 RepID=UPI0005376080|nr:hypothetical protein NM22_02505 [Vibrio tubiashii]
MNIERHGITLGIERFGEDSLLVIKARGKLTHQDYQVIGPILDSTITGLDQKRIKLLVDITEFSGWELRAAWDDFQLGAKIGLNFEKVAIYGDKNWQSLAAKVGSWFVSGEMSSFGDYKSAVDWLLD